ncbi:MAG: SRPBCC domain-containing protein [Gemmatimonadaceae bacterium]|nr:SRPBCC domain-containing protein [Gemmatimonadaceae bacterium]
MKFIKRLLILAVLVAGGLYLYGRSLPREHVASSTIVLVASPDTVYKVIRNVSTTPSWWSDMKGARRLTDKARETWEENMGAAGVMHVEMTTLTEPRQVVTTIVDNEEAGWGGVWTYDITSSGSGTEVRITEDGYVDSPIFRVLMKWMGEHRTMDSYLRSLGGHFGEMVTPRHGG